MGLSYVRRNGAPVLHLGAQEPSVENVGMLAVMSNRRVDLPQVYSGDLSRQERAKGTLLLIGRYRLVLDA